MLVDVTLTSNIGRFTSKSLLASKYLIWKPEGHPLATFADTVTARSIPSSRAVW